MVSPTDRALSPMCWSDTPSISIREPLTGVGRMARQVHRVVEGENLGDIKIGRALFPGWVQPILGTVLLGALTRPSDLFGTGVN